MWEFFQACLWPAVALVAIGVFRTPMSSLLERLKHAKVAGAEFDVSPLEKAKDIAVFEQSSRGNVHALENEGPPSAAANGLTAKASLAELSPSALVMESWRECELALSRLFLAAQPHEDGISLIHHKRSPLEVLRFIEQKEYLPPPILKMLDELRRLRNAVTHNQEEPTVGAALSYAESAEFATSAINRNASRLRGTD